MIRTVYLVFVTIAGMLGVGWAHPSIAATFTVNSTVDDAVDADGCEHPYLGASDDCTLREAITAANAAGGTDTITFSISTLNFADDGDGQFTITLGSALPTMTGTTEVSGSGMWDGGGVIAQRPGIRILGDGSIAYGLYGNPGVNNFEIKGLTLDNFGTAGIYTNGNNNIIGTDCDGSGDTVEGNNIINNDQNGIYVLNTNGIVAGNHIGYVMGTGATAANGSGSLYQGGLYVSGSGHRIGYGSTNCTAADQRNVISGNNANGIMFTATSSSVVRGNYIGTNNLGMASQANSQMGIFFDINNSSIYIGTNGDGVNDAQEGNVISGNTLSGIFIHQDVSNQTNRISGNYIGTNATSTYGIPNGQNGLHLRGGGLTIVGYCTTTDSAALCSNGGAAATQSNVISGNADDGVRLGTGANNHLIHANFIGVGADGVTSIPNVGSGIEIRANNNNHVIGKNTVGYNNVINHNGVYGIYVAAGNNDVQLQSENNSINGNDIQSNGSGGIRCEESMEYPSGLYTFEYALSDNDISSNLGTGVSLEACQWTLSDNLFDANEGWGVTVDVKEKPDEPVGTGTLYNNPYDALSPSNVANDLVPKPNLVGNTFSKNGDGGLRIIDTVFAQSTATVLTDNTFSQTDPDTLRFFQGWYVAVQLVNAAGTASITSGSHTINIAPTVGSCITGCSGSSFGVFGGTGIWGLSGVNYHNAESWFMVPELEVSADGIETNLNPYLISVTGDHRTVTSETIVVNAAADDDNTTVDGIAQGVPSNGLYRYQIAGVRVGTIPSAPTNVAPQHLATGINPAVQLQASSFVDTAESHASTKWQIYSSSSECTSGSIGNVYDYASTTDLTTHTIASGILQANSTYYWKVIYKNSFGNTSTSSCTAFTTWQTVPTFTGTLPDITVPEDTTVTSTTPLSDYFFDAEGELLSYSVTVSDDTVQVTVTEDSTLTFASDADWNGSITATIQACDTDGECVDGNLFTVEVSPVNDAPTAPTSRFSPNQGDETTDLTPTISWAAADDVDDEITALSYQLRLSTNSDPINAADATFSSQAGEAAITITALNDDTNYYYVVRTVDDDDAKSDWSDVQQFMVNTSHDPVLNIVKQATSSSSAIAGLPAWLMPWLPIPQVAYAATSLTRYEQFSAWLDTALWLTAVVILVVLLVSIIHATHPKYLFVYWFTHPRYSFMKVHSNSAYCRYKVRAHFTQAAVVLCVLFTFTGIAAKTVQASLVVQSLQAIATTETVPGDIITVTIDYDNSGDGDATNVTLTDTWPDSVSYVPNSLQQATTSATELAVNLGTITNGAAGQITYQLSLSNPTAASTIQLPAAILTANELTEATSTNSVELSVMASQLAGMVTTSRGNAIAGANLQLIQDGSEITSTTTSATGSAELLGLRSGMYQLVTSADGYLTDSRTVTLTAAQTTTETIILTRQTTGGTDSGGADTDDADDETIDDDSDEDDVLVDDTESLTDEELEILQTLTTDLTSHVSVHLDESITAGTYVFTGSSWPILELFTDPPEEIVLSGQTIPNAKITITICYTQLSTNSDDEGRWTLTISRHLLAEGENVITAQAEKDGVITEPVEITRIVVPEQPRRTLLYGSGVVVLAVLMLNIVGYLVVVSRGLRRRKAWALIIVSTLASLGCYALVIAPYYWKIYDVTAKPEQVADASVQLTQLNQQSVISPIELKNVSELALQGNGDANRDLALTLCPGQPFSTTTINSQQTWEDALKVSALPKGTFTLSSQLIGETLDVAIPLATITITRRDYYQLALTTFIVGMILNLLASGFTWLRYYRQTRIVPPPPDQTLPNL